MLSLDIVSPLRHALFPTPVVQASVWVPVVELLGPLFDILNAHRAKNSTVYSTRAEQQEKQAKKFKELGFGGASKKQAAVPKTRARAKPITMQQSKRRTRHSAAIAPTHVFSTGD